MSKRFKSSKFLTILIFILFNISKVKHLELFSHYALIKIASIKKNDNLFFAVGLILYTKHQHQRANALFSSVHDFGNLAPRAVYLISLCASFQMNLKMLNRLELESHTPSIKYFVRALMLHESSWNDSINYFMQVHERYLSECKEEVSRFNLPEYVRNSINVSRPLLQSQMRKTEKSLLNSFEPRFTNLESLSADISDLILISYTSSYLYALASTVIARIRKTHKQAIFIVVVISGYENENSISTFCQTLSLKFGNIFWKVVVSQYDLPICSSVFRLVIVRELFEKHGSQSILMLDGDTSFIKTDPVQVWEDSKRDFDIALLQTETFCPWERISLGFTILNNTESTNQFLFEYDSYVTAHILGNRSFWTLDQTAASLVLEALLQRNSENGGMGINVFDLSQLVSLRDFIFTDKKLVNLKLRAKESNLDFLSGMEESLYLA